MTRKHFLCFQTIMILALLQNLIQSVNAQDNNFHLSMKTSILYANGSDLPFWFSNNQQGIFEQADNSYFLAGISIAKSYRDSIKSKWDYTLGLYGVEAKGTGSYFQPNEWFAGVRYKLMKFQVGAWSEETLFGGLSSTNGDMRWSNNARPLPRARLSTTGFIPIPLVHQWFFNANYDEGLLNDQRYVMNAHMHHKSLYIQKALKKDLHFTIGLDHYAMWGGISPEQGELPGFESYLRYVFVFNGSEKFNTSDKLHVAGNTLGRYFLKLEKFRPNVKNTWYLDHPFEDRVTMQNFFDNLIGFVSESTTKKLISNILIEIMFTNDQNLSRKKGLDSSGNIIQDHIEGYFQHGTYRSGFSYNNRMIASPFFTPMVIKDGVNMGTGNNRVILFHTGLEGYFNEHIKWKTLLSFSSNKGTFDKIYDQIKPGFFNEWRDQVSGYAEINYQLPNKGWDFAFSVAADKGQMLEDQLGVQLSVRKSIAF